MGLTYITKDPSYCNLRMAITKEELRRVLLEMEKQAESVGLAIIETKTKCMTRADGEFKVGGELYITNETGKSHQFEDVNTIIREWMYSFTEEEIYRYSYI